MTHAKPSPLIIIALFIIAIHGLALLVLPWLLERVDSSMVGFGMVCYLLLVIMVYIYHSAGVKGSVASAFLGVLTVGALSASSYWIAYTMTGGSCRFDEGGQAYCVMPIAEMLLGFVIGVVSAVPLVLTYHVYQLSYSERLPVVMATLAVIYFGCWTAYDVLM